MRQSNFQLTHQTNDLSTTLHQQVNILTDNSTDTTARSEFMRQDLSTEALDKRFFDHPTSASKE